MNNQQQEQLKKMQEEQQKREKATKEITQENDILLLQLQQVQEELESTFLQKLQLEQQAHQGVDRDKNDAPKELQKVKGELLNTTKVLDEQHQRKANRKPNSPRTFATLVRAITKPFNRLSKAKRKTHKHIEFLRTSGLFDEAWYAAVNEDVVKGGYEPVEHYVRYGATEGRNPSPVFDTRRYLEINPDVTEAGMNPLVHYARYGMAEDRTVCKT